jgi:hypothetical protein
MKVLISWSGKTSGGIARLFRDWLPTVLPSVEPWVSSEDIHKGKRWTGELAGQLKDTQFGIIIVLPDNQDSPWLNFEAGAISKWVSAANVAPLLFGMTASDLRGPLSQFQATVFSKDDLLKLIAALNAAAGEPVKPGQLAKTFEFTWPGLTQQLQPIVAEIESAGPSSGSAPGPSSLELTPEHVKILAAVATSEDNFMQTGELVEAVQMSQARVEHYLEELVRADYLSEKHVPMLGETYKAIAKGRKYLMDHGVL